VGAVISAAWPVALLCVALLAWDAFRRWLAQARLHTAQVAHYEKVIETVIKRFEALEAAERKRAQHTGFDGPTTRRAG
jgi:hypothetical protein